MCVYTEAQTNNTKQTKVTNNSISKKKNTTAVGDLLNDMTVQTQKHTQSISQDLTCLPLSPSRTLLTATTTYVPQPTTRADLPLAPCTTPTTGPPTHQGALPPSAAVPEARGPRPAVEPHPGPCPPQAGQPVTTPDPRLDSPITATPSSTPSPGPARASSPRLTPPRRPLTSPETAAYWTALRSWPMTTTATPPTILTAWASPRPAWLLWRPARPMRCTGWDRGWGQEWGWGLEWGLGWGQRPRRAQRLDWGNTVAPPASPTPRSILTTPTADTRRGCRHTCEVDLYPPSTHTRLYKRGRGGSHTHIYTFASTHTHACIQVRTHRLRHVNNHKLVHMLMHKDTQKHIGKHTQETGGMRVRKKVGEKTEKVFW